MGENILTMRNITKSFPGVRALDQVDFTLRAGEIHALMGENGAGKSTLIKVLTGAEVFESGTVWIKGLCEGIINHSPQEAQARGISTVYQEVNLCPNLTVAENLFVGRQPRTKLGFINWKEINRHARDVMDEFEIKIDVEQPLENYSVAIQQMVAIARAIDISTQVLILDEPTSSLDEEEVAKLFSVMRKLRDQGMGIIFVTHFLEQVYEVCDRITVLRNGALVGEYEIEALPRIQLVAKMMGKEYDDVSAIKGATDDAKVRVGTPLIRAKGLGCAGSIKPFDLDVYKGEVVGLTGLLGGGRTELVRVLYAADKPDSGELFWNGKKVHFRSPLDAMKCGIGFLPENRKEEGVIADLSVRENMIVAMQAKRGTFRLLKKREQEKLADQYIELLQIKTAGIETPVKQLSGGNQQKVILARWLMTNPAFLILDEPTRGIDVGTKTEIQKLVLKLANEGMAVIFISSEVEEMLRTVSRMGVMRDGAKVGELAEPNLTQEAIMEAIAGGGQDV